MNFEIRDFVFIGSGFLLATLIFLTVPQSVQEVPIASRVQSETVVLDSGISAAVETSESSGAVIVFQDAVVYSREVAGLHITEFPVAGYSEDPKYDYVLTVVLESGQKLSISMPDRGTAEDVMIFIAKRCV